MLTYVFLAFLPFLFLGMTVFHLLIAPFFSNSILLILSSLFFMAILHFIYVLCSSPASLLSLSGAFESTSITPIPVLEAKTCKAPTDVLVDQIQVKASH